jgi:hypothetical protein
MKLISGCIAGAFINVVFWVLYTQTGNVVPSVGITAVIVIGVFSALRRMDKRKLR